ncbi:hypothetical protein [Urechidicola croceus]|nr:hypothetical protein [Urechidicola croceus]
MNAKKEYAELVAQQNLFANIPTKVASLSKENIYLDSILNKYQFSADKSFQSNLLESITEFSENNNIDVVSFEEPHTYLKNGTSVSSFMFAVKGNFNDMLKLVYEIEQIKKLGNILSVNFEKKKNYRTNKEFLQCKILLQRINN